jgi:hypothetical protein
MGLVADKIITSARFKDFAITHMNIEQLVADPERTLLCYSA